MPARNKKPHASAPDKRHDAGLIAPGKRITKDRQNGVSANGPQLNPAPHSLSTSSASSSAPSPLDDAARDHASTAPDMAKSSKSLGPAATRVAEDAVDSDGNYIPSLAVDSAAGRDRHSLANGSSTGHLATVAASASNSLESVTTIIGPHSTWDVLAILMLLLQLPPLLLILVQVSFAFMTFGNTTNTWSLFNLSPASDWFRSHGSNPSAVVTVIVDIVATWTWLMLPVLQTWILDLAPAVVALSLGGGAAAKDSWRHASICLATVSAGHLFHDRQRRQYFINLIWEGLSKVNVSNVPFLAPSVLLPNSPYGTTRSWARIVLELHIVTHGAVRVIRRCFDRSSQPRPTPTVSKTDPESATGTTHSASSQNAVDSSADVGRSGSTDGRPPGLPPAATRDKQMSSGKKRRKQATLVRSQQPFWAAIATTKIQVSKEIEQSHSERDSFEAKASDVTNVGNASTNAMYDRVWVTKVNQTEVWFTANLSNTGTKPSESDLSADRSSRRTSQDSLIIDVHINGTFWHFDVNEERQVENGEVTPRRVELEGKISGLTPASTYFVEFVRRVDETLIFTTSVLTRPEENSGQTTALVPQAPDAMRPSSPATTLKKSIDTAETKLTESKARSNKLRKTRQGNSRNLKQEVGDLNRNLASCGTNERQQQRQIQYKQNIKQAEETAADLAAQIADLGETPKSDQQSFETSQATWTDVDKSRQKLRKQLEWTKRDGQRKSTEAHSENHKVRAKREKAEGRLANLTEKRKTTTEENETKRNANLYPYTQHSYKMDNFRNQERQTIKDIQKFEGQRADLESRISQITSQEQPFFDSVFGTASQGGQQSGVFPQTPDSIFAVPASGAVGSGRPSSAMMNTYGIGGYLTNTPPGAMSRGQPAELQRQRPRGRSSSMLSNISGFTDDEMTPYAGGARVGGQDAAAVGAQIARNGSGSPRDAVGLSFSSQQASPIGTEMARSSPGHLSKR